MEPLVSTDFLETSNVNKRNLDEIVSLVEELVINKVRIEKIKNELSDNTHIKILDQELRIISEIQASIKKVRLIRIKTITNSLTDLVHQCCKENDTTAEFLFNGQETEVENSLINYVHDILVHFIKDIFKNDFSDSKKELNEIRVFAYSDGKNLTTVIESNGKGFNYEDTCKTLKKENLELSAFNEDEAKNFFSMIKATDNMDELLKLRSDLIYLDGTMNFESTANEFRRITIIIPLSSSIMQGMLVTIGDQTYAIPLDFIETIINANSVVIQTFQNHGMIIHMDHVIELISVSELLGIETGVEAASIIIVTANNKRAALLVDSLLDQTDMVIKPKHSIMADIPEIKGTTILGDGLVTLVLDIPSIIKGI